MFDTIFQTRKDAAETLRAFALEVQAEGCDRLADDMRLEASRFWPDPNRAKIETPEELDRILAEHHDETRDEREAAIEAEHDAERGRLEKDLFGQAADLARAEASRLGV